MVVEVPFCKNYECKKRSGQNGCDQEVPYCENYECVECYIDALGNTIGCTGNRQCDEGECGFSSD